MNRWSCCPLPENLSSVSSSFFFFFCFIFPPSAHISPSSCFPALWQPSELCGCLFNLLWLCWSMGGEEFQRWTLVSCFQTAGVCRAHQNHRKDKHNWCMRSEWEEKEKKFILNDMCWCPFHPPPSGAAKDHWTARLWGCGVSEKGSDPQWPPQRPAALPCGWCLGESTPSFLQFLT